MYETTIEGYSPVVFGRLQLKSKIGLDNPVGIWVSHQSKPKD